MLPLLAHAFDVAAVAEALLERTLLGARVRQLGNRSGAAWDNLSATIVGAAFLHDVGKCNAGFWRRQFDPPSTPPRRTGAEPRAGHLLEVGPLLHDSRRSKRVVALPDRATALTPWFDLSGGAGRVFLTALAHHGRPVDEQDLATAARMHAGLWQPTGAYDPLAELEALADALLAWRPRVVEAALRVAEPPPACLHAVAGLVTLADWIASDRAFFDFPVTSATERPAHAVAQSTYLLRHMRLDPADARAGLMARALGFGAVFRAPETDAPREATPLQVAMADCSLGPIVVAESETGSGKTEAALWRWRTLFEAGEVDGLAFLLPTRVAAVAMEKRIRTFAERLFPDDAERPNVVLAVPGYTRADGQEGVRLPGFEVLWPDRADEAAAHRRWAAEHPKRALAAAIAVGTVDQALLGALRTRHAHLRGTALLRSLLVVDEVHASDRYMTRLLLELLDRHQAAGGHALLLSATLGSGARRTLLHAGDVRPPRAGAPAPDDPYPAVWDRHGGRKLPQLGCKQVEITCAGMIDDAAAIATAAAEAARAGARVLVVRNTVAGVLAVQRALEARGGVPLFRAAGVVAPHHGRFAAGDRWVLDAAVETAFGRGGPRDGGLVLCGTQTLEMSLDIDADFLLTDLCPMDVLLQRIGRLHRHAETKRPPGFNSACSTVLTPASRDLSPFLRGGRHGLGGNVYPNLLSTEATWRLLSANSRILIPDDNRRLVETATHDCALRALAEECGPAWEKAWAQIIGKERGMATTADVNLLDWRRDWEQMAWPPELEVGIATRLGLNDRRVTLDPPILSPFGVQLETGTIPGWMAKGVDLAIEMAATASGAEDTSLIRFGDKTFTYSRLGLERMSELSPRVGGAQLL